MTKLIKILGRIFGSLLEWSFILIIVLAFIIRTSTVQTFFAQKAASYLSKELGAEVKVDQVAIVFIDKVALDGILIRDQSGDTLLYAKRIIVNLDNLNFSKQSFTIASADVDNAFVHIQRSKDDVFNHAFIKDYFSSTKKKKNKIKFKINTAELSNSRFEYDDHRKELRTSGMDYFHLKATHINGSLSGIKIEKDVITANVDKINMQEKCGFKLNNLNTKAQISSKGVLLSDLEIKTDDSYVKSKKLNMLSNNYNCFKYFVDSVTFDGQINESDLSLRDVAYFAYALEGMDDQIQLKTEIYRKVTNLKLKNFDLHYKENTRVKGTIQLDDYREFKQGFYSEKLNYAYIDLEEIKTLKLPNSASSKYLSISPKIAMLKFIRAHQIRLDGMYSDFVVGMKYLETGLGGAQIDNGIQFTASEDNTHYKFKRSEASQYDIKVNSFNLGTYTGDKNMGIVDGTFFLTGDIYSAADIRFSQIIGDVFRFDYLDYPYSNIKINEGSYKDKIFFGDISIADKSLELNYNGFIDFSGNQHMHFTVDLNKALLDNINLSLKDSELKTKIVVDIFGDELDNFAGSVSLENFNYKSEVAGDENDYKRDDENISISKLALEITRSPERDYFSLTSSEGDAWIDGKVDFHHLGNEFSHQLSRVFPSLFSKDKIKKERHNAEDHFKFHAEIKDANEFLKIFYPELEIANNTTLDGQFNSGTSELNLTAKSKYLHYKKMKFENLNLSQTMDSNNINAMYTIDKFTYDDSIQFNGIDFKTTGGNDKLFHILTWDPGTITQSEISWETNVYALDNFKMVLNPSYFFIEDLQWNIAHEATVQFQGDTIIVDKFELRRDIQNIAINGIITDRDSDHLNFEIKDLKLGELSNFITTEYPMTGLINSKGYITNPFHNLDFRATGSLTEFEVKDRRIGDINILAIWDKEKQSINTQGDLTYIDEKTFDFVGDYYIFEDENNLDFDLNFDYTDLQFTNAFMDPDVMSEIRGLLYGQINLTGSPRNVILEGAVNLAAGSVYLDILGVHIGIDGEIDVDEYGFYINGIPVFDEDGNSGLLVGSVFHENFKDFNFDLQFDLESQSRTDGTLGLLEMNKFLVMDLPYSNDGLYYGTGYVTGTANIFGYTNKLEITVDFETEKGTVVNVPMYGVGEIEDKSFISFVESRSQLDSVAVIPKFDLSNVVIDLNFVVTKDADINIIFNEDIGDIISANGSGDIAISLDEVGNVKMEGVYVVEKGTYNFAMGPLKQKFIIENGGSISWAGDPYDAELNLRTYYVLNANIAEISNNQFGSGKGSHIPVYSYLALSGSMTAPAIAFDIKAPQADETGQTLINQIKSDKDLLSKQFFSLMLFRRFQPIDADKSRNATGALDMVANQINYLLAAVSTEYNLNLDYDSDEITGDNKFEFGVSKGFLDDRLILSGSFGVQNYGDNADIKDANGNDVTGQLIGDVSLEYLLNEKGTFRVNIFNQSTDKSVIQKGNLGDFTQGAGLNYHEDFNNFDDFKLIQYIFDIFRKKGNKRYPVKRKRQQRLVSKDLKLMKKEEKSEQTEPQSDPPKE